MFFESVTVSQTPKEPSIHVCVNQSYVIFQQKSEFGQHLQAG